MFIHAISRPLSTVSHVPGSGVTTVADHLRRAGADVVEDIGIALSDISRAARELSEELIQRWEASPPEVVHTIGVVATMAAVAARPEGTRIVATFDERPAAAELEKSLAREVDAVVPLSTAEMADWRNAGARTFNVGAMMLASPAVTESTADARGHVVCLSTGRALEDVVESMTLWGPTRLVLMGRLDASSRARVQQLAVKLGVSDRIDYQPGLRGERRSRVWAEAALLIGGADGARHGGHVLEAAAHGVPAVALAHEAHLDHIVEGASGVLVDPREGPRGLGRGVATVLRDPLRCRGMGSATLVRAESLHDQASFGERLLEIYRQVCGILPASTKPAPAPLTPEATKLALNYMPLARQLAHRYSGRGQRLEDLVQVASLGLVRAASRFNPDYGTEFHSFAVPTILGELRRHFRDHAWAARVPRSLQEVTLKVQRASDELRASKGEEVTPAEVAAHLGLLEEEVRQAMQARGEAMSSKSLDHPMGENGDESYGDLVGELDPDLEYVELRESVREAMMALPEREREILLMRFYGEHTQSEIAEQLGLSQVHVSRLITRTLAALRDHVTNDVPLPRSWAAEEVIGQPVAAGRRAA